jgi:hypothetical protein
VHAPLYCRDGLTPIKGEDTMTLELIPLCTATVTLAEPIVLAGTPGGTRMILEVVDARTEGERLTSRIKGSANADWVLVGPDGTAALDVRATLETDDGALVYVQYTGRNDLSGGPGSAPIYVAPRFETGDERYTWLNRIQAVGKGRLDGAELTYDWFEVR